MQLRRSFRILTSVCSDTIFGAVFVRKTELNGIGSRFFGGGLSRYFRGSSVAWGGGILDKRYVIFFLIILNKHYFAISLTC